MRERQVGFGAWVEEEAHQQVYPGFRRYEPRKKIGHPYTFMSSFSTHNISRPHFKDFQQR
jgi:hypothetical protein